MVFLESWFSAKASDNIFDGPDELASFTTADLTPGPHQIAVRSTDSHGNQAFENVLVKIEPPATAK